MTKEVQESIKPDLKKMRDDADKGYWVNNTYIRFKNAVKPCKYCGFCPYGQLVEAFPLDPIRRKIPSKMTCSVFGHHCPVFYHAELFAEEEEITKEEQEEFTKECREFLDKILKITPDKEDSE